MWILAHNYSASFPFHDFGNFAFPRYSFLLRLVPPAFATTKRSLLPYMVYFVALPSHTTTGGGNSSGRVLNFVCTSCGVLAAVCPLTCLFVQQCVCVEEGAWLHAGIHSSRQNKYKDEANACLPAWQWGNVFLSSNVGVFPQQTDIINTRMRNVDVKKFRFYLPGLAWPGSRMWMWWGSLLRFSQSFLFISNVSLKGALKTKTFFGLWAKEWMNEGCFSLLLLKYSVTASESICLSNSMRM